MAGGVIGKVTAGGGTHLVTSTFYGTCQTAAATQVKVVTLTDTTQDSATLITGMLLCVKFTYSNTAANPQLKIQTNGGTQLIAAKSIMCYGTTATGKTVATSWRAGAIVSFVYDGTNWVEISSIDDNTVYTHPTTAGNKHIPSGGSSKHILKYSSAGTAAWSNVSELIYPVGSIYMSIDSTSPSTLFGGTWTRITGAFLLAATDDGNSGASQAAGNTGGEAEHLLTGDESGLKNHSHDYEHAQSTTSAGGHNHSIPFGSDSGNFFTRGQPNGSEVVTEWGLRMGGTWANEGRRVTTWSSWNGDHWHGLNHAVNTTAQVGYENANSAHNNMPPYLSVYVWKRTA